MHQLLVKEQEAPVALDAVGAATGQKKGLGVNKRA